jgi:RNA 3'-terminal phosphate cyclase (ATP)
MQPILIDGSIGYGQVLRTTIALSSLLRIPVKIINIRKRRPRSGLMFQHLTGVKIAAEFCDAKVKGLKLYSTQIEFIPQKLNVPDRKKIDIGTAGSIGLLLQTLIPIILFSGKEVELEIKGGTAGLGAPPIEYLQNILFPILSRLGVKVPEIKIVRYGFYPKGGGIVKCTFYPVNKLKSISLIERGKVKSIEGISVCGSLPEHITKRQANSARKFLMENGFNSKIRAIRVRTFSPGTCITIWANCEKSILGADALGKRGKPAEEVGKEAAKGLLSSINANCVLDKYMADQIIPFIALAKGKSRVKVEKITEHCLTNIKVCEKIFGVKFDVDRKNKIIEVEGIGFKG